MGCNGKVVHISNDTHSNMMKYCSKNGLQASVWVGGLIEDAVSGRKGSVEITEPEPEPEPEQVKGPGSGPPFWANDK